MGREEEVMDDLIRKSDAIKSVLGITMLQGRVPIDTVIFQINNIPAVEPCKDAISREWLLNELEEMNVANFYEANFHSNEMYGQMKRMIKAAPSVTVEPRQGEWVTKAVKKFCAPDCWYPGIFAIEGSWNEEEGSWLEEQNGFCSECEKQDEHYYGHKYCPNCGARMFAKDTNVPNKEGADDEHDK